MIAETKRIKAAERLGILPQNMPRHIAIILDGNGRWAQQRGLPRYMGHQEGGKTVQRIAQYCVELGIEYLTLYSFSIQNWKRPSDEVEFLMHLIASYLNAIEPNLMRDNVRLKHLGRTEGLPQIVLDALQRIQTATASNTGMTLGLALNYGAREEIIDATKAIAQKCADGQLDPNQIEEDLFSAHLYTAGWKDPDLVIRTSGEMRISNFLLWQISYAEFYVTSTLWPDFAEEDLDKAIQAYALRQRRFGGLNAALPSENGKS